MFVSKMRVVATVLALSILPVGAGAGVAVADGFRVGYLVGRLIRR